jgi:hypothetical protein
MENRLSQQLLFSFFEWFYNLNLKSFSLEKEFRLLARASSLVGIA